MPATPTTYSATGAIQYSTVTVTGTYTITVDGAQGGDGDPKHIAYNSTNYAGGVGAEIVGTFALTAGEKLEIVVGGGGGAYNNGGAYAPSVGGGGGGSFVLANTGPGGAYVPLIVAGGGGGAGVLSAGGNASSDISAHGAGGGGAVGYYGAGGGAGVTANGGGSYGGSSAGAGFARRTSNSGNDGAGGFGGGGASAGYSYSGGGGGGGYTGGGAGGGNGNGYGYGGAGGTSFDGGVAVSAGSAASFNAANNRNGGVTIAPTSPPTVTPEYATVLAGGTVTGTGATNGTGALKGDSDPNGGTLSITQVNGTAVAAGSTSASGGTAATGTYGALTIGADGSYSYVANNGLAIVTHADGSAIVDTFTDVVAASEGTTANSSLAVTVTLATGGTETVANPAGSATYTIGATTLTLNETANSTYGGVIQDGSSGNTGGKVVKSGAATLTLTAHSTYTGGTTISAGQITEQNLANALGTGNVSIASGATLGFTNTGGYVYLTPATYSGAGTIAVNGQVAVGGGGGNAFIALSSGGLVNVQSGILNGSSSGQGLWTNNQGSLNIAAGATFDGVEGTIRVDALTGAGTLKGGYGGTGSTTIGVADGSGTFSGVIQNSQSALVLNKVGTGAETLTGNETFTGATTISGGVLAVDGAYASLITVASGGALRGTGASSSGVVVQSSGLFTPGEGGSGAFTTTALALNAGATLGISASGGATTSVNAGSVTLGGALNFAYTGGAEAYGTTYEVVNNTGAAAVSGTFSNYAQGTTFVSGGETFQVSYSGGTGNDVVLTDVTNTAPTITGANGAQTTNDKTPDHPFSTVVVTDPDAGQTQTTTVSFTAANGTLAGLGAGVTSGSTVTYTVTGSASAVTTALEAATFTPTQNQVTPGQTVTTTFTIGDNDGHGGSTSNAVTQVTTTSVNDAPTAANGSAGQAITDKATATPFAQVTVNDPDVGQTETATITYTAANGVLSGTGLAGSAGNYTLSAGSAAALQSALDALTFTPTANQVAPGATVQTTLNVSVSDGTATGSTSDTVTTTSVNDAPTITGSMGGQTVGDRQTINPFATVTVADPDTGQGETVTVTLSNAANGVLTGGGFTPTATPGVYSVTVAAGGAGASAAQAQADLRAAVFTPTPTAIPTAPTQTTFTVAVNDGTATASDSGTVVTATHTTNTPPTLGGFAAGQTTNDKAAASPFANATVADPDAQTETVTVTLSAAANGTLAGGGFASIGAGSYQVVAASAAAAQADLRALVFTPTMNQVAPGQTVTTGFTVAVNDTQTTVQNTQTSEVVTSVNDAPTLAGTHASATSDHATVNPFSGVTVTDPDTGQGETVTVTLSNPANGTLAGGGFVQTATPGVYTVTETAGSAGASAAAAQSALQAAVFTPTAQPAGAAATQTTFSVQVSDGTAATATDTATVVTATHTTNTPVAATNTTPAQTTNDKATTQPFAGVTVTDPDTGQTETATIAYTAANGTLTGAGLAGAAGSYSLSASSAAALQTALDALVFTPTMNQVAPGQTVQTVFGVTVSDGTTTAQTSDTVTTTSVNDAPALGAFQTMATAPADAPVTLQPNVTVTDPDVGAMVTSAQVAIGGFVAGDLLRVTPSAGVTAAYNAATGVLTLSGTASDAAYQQTLQTVAFLHDGTVNAGARTVTFTVTDDQGAATIANETVSVGGYIQPSTGGGGGTGSVPTNLDAQQLFSTQTDNLTRAPLNDPAFSTPTSPLYAQAQAEKGIAAALDSGQLSLADAQNALYHLVDGSTSVAEISYAFFTGKTPTQAGLNYLVHSAQNTTDLNDPYYAQFTTENRYINFANNLATGPGAGAAAFQANYGSLSLTDATAKAYAAIFGTTPTADKITAILTAQVSNGLGGTETRAQYFSDIIGGSAASQKAAAIGFLLADSVKEGFGTYQQADLHFLADLAHGTAVFNVDLLAAYGTAPSLVGAPVTDTTLGS